LRTAVGQRRTRKQQAGGSYWADDSGSSALEFALVAMPLILLLFAIFEVVLVYFANYELDNGVAQASRLIRTGQAQTQNFDAGRFKSEVCKHLTAPITCTGLKLDVSHYPSFSNAASSLSSPLDAGGNLKSNFNYDPGAGGDVVVVRAFFEWDLMAKLPKQIALSNMSNGNRLLTSTAAFRNEPFQPQ
jgi:Flp pilus assembly protein TadG